MNAELARFFENELSECGYAGIELRCAPSKYEIIVKATKTQAVVGEKGKRIRELKAVLCQRFNWQPEQIEIYAQKIDNRGLCSSAQAESIKFKLLEGVAVRK